MPYTTAKIGHNPMSPEAAAALVGMVGRGLADQSIAGLHGIAAGARHAPEGWDAATDAAANAVRDTQQRLDDKTFADLTPADIEGIRRVSPLMDAAGNGPMGAMSRRYGEGSQQLADLAGKYLGPRAAGVAGALADTAPYLMDEEGLLGRVGLKAAEYKGLTFPDEPPNWLPTYPGRGSWNSTPGAIEREGEAARRANPAYAYSVNKATDVGHATIGIPGFHPDAMVVDAHDPADMQNVGRLIMEPGDDMMRGRSADVPEAWRRQGIGTSLLRKGVDYAHEQGMDWGSDANLSPSQYALYHKLREQGYPVEFHPEASVNGEMAFDESGDPHMVAPRGEPVAIIRKPTDPETATTDEVPTFDPNNSILPIQAHAEGGEVGAGAGLVARMAERMKAAYGADSPAADNFVKWFGNSVTHDDGVPRVYYTGTSKDKDFSAFNVGRHGAWFTTDPKSASDYALGNDSMGYSYASGKLSPTNMASRVMPAYLKIENPYTGDIPQEFVRDNYKRGQSDFFDTLRAQGYDGWMPTYANNSIAVPLNGSTQIKSAVGNSGAFDPAAKVMTKAEGGEIGGGLGAIARMAERLKGLPETALIKGQTVPVNPSPAIRQVAENYKQAAGITTPAPRTYVKVDPQQGQLIAAAFDQMPHAPDDPKVQAAYQAMVKETLAQYQHAKAAGLKVDFIPPDAPDPYAASPRLAIHDIQQNNHMWVFPTDSGFGSGPESAALDHSKNPMLLDSGENFGGVPAKNNDIFRVVHDYFGHAKEGNGFRADGEENAWRQHASMYSDLARPAMTTETRGQNNWVNWGPFADQNKMASGIDTVYAPQKMGLLPDHLTQDTHENDDFSGLDDLSFIHYGNPTANEVTLDPKFMGRGIKGQEARRGGPKVTSLYAEDNSAPEPGLESKTKYRVQLPADSLYDLSADPDGHIESNRQPSGAVDMSGVESDIKAAGHLGYHIPNPPPGAPDALRGQARVFQPVQATRVEPASEGAGNEEDWSAGFARGGVVRRAGGTPEGGELGAGLGVIGRMAERLSAADLAAKYATDAATASQPAVSDAPAIISRTMPAPFPELASRYPEQLPGVPAADEKTGKPFLQKQLSPEAKAVAVARKTAQQDIDAGNYDPYFNVSDRADVDPNQFPQAVDTLSIVPKRDATVNKYSDLANSPESKARLLGAYQAGLPTDESKNWYFMKQLADKFNGVYGDMGPAMFRSRFADAMSATTAAQKPEDNLLMAHYGNYLKNQGQQMPEAGHAMPFPIGGLYAGSNAEMYNKIMNAGIDMSQDNPKRINFSANFQGHANRGTVDKVMSQLWDPKMQAPAPNTYGIYEGVLHDLANSQGVDPRFFQEVTWNGAQQLNNPSYVPKAMIRTVNEAIERTHRITGMDHDAIVDGIVRGNIPLYGEGGSIKNTSSG